MKPIEPPYPRWYDLNAQCDYHARATGHSIKNYPAFKSKVQSLLDAKWLSFEGMTKSPNVTRNPLSNHGSQRANTIENGSNGTIRRKVSKVKIPMKFIFKALLDTKFLQS